MSEPLRLIREARGLADTLEQEGRKYHANIIRALCRSQACARAYASRRTAEVQQLQARLAPLAQFEKSRERANGGTLPLLVELETTAAQLQRMHQQASFAGDDVSVRVTDAPYLIDLMRRTADMLR